jgi:uncharacterized membrane protein
MRALSLRRLRYHASMAKRPPSQSDGAATDQAAQNIAALMSYYAHEESRISRSQHIVEAIGNRIGQPSTPLLIVGLVLVWMLANGVFLLLGKEAPDPAPYFYLQGLISLGALLTTTIVLSRQNRMADLAEQRAHLDLRINLLTEQKAAKLIELIEELRRDLPDVKNRADTEAAALGQSMNPQSVRAALDEHKESSAAITAPPP